MFLNSIYIIAGLIGFIISAILLNNHKTNPIMNLYMVLLIFIISCRFFTFGVVNLIDDKDVITLYIKYSNLASLVIPFSYLYFKKLVTNNKPFEKEELYHFIFPIGYFFITLKVSNFISPRYPIKIIMFLFFLAFLLTYIILSYHLLKKNIWSRKEENKTINKQYINTYNWSLFLFIALILASTRLSISLFIETSENSPSKGLSYQWISSLIWIAILVKILITPEILYGYKLLNEKLKENRNSNLKFNEIWQLQAAFDINNTQHLILKEKINDNLQFYFEEIERISVQHNFFRDSKLTLSDLATELRIPKSHLSYLFKYHSTVSFSEYKKVIRIQDAINLIENGYLKNNTLDSLSKKVGFTSYNPFFTSFKETTGMAPLEYMNKINSIV
ncbi:AraC family transcriptional regulator [Flavobacterium sp. NG2]|uniref:helix-turn-helix domain-containing protein n=1 Tax=Flavobacterium sp. NG2 TaxID=3097547 RepID=UPI002A801377|nr:AraC family transcriptional regulator [Flavobacterium sp. NG2]WPR70474.1 AraC family transcriptional regulator [Flavobacterium sp. NG2]